MSMQSNTWVASLPESWGSVPFGSIFRQQKRKNTDLSRDFVLSVLRGRGVIPYSEKGNIGNKVSMDLSGYKLVDRGDFVLNSMNLYIGSVGVSEYDGITSTAYIVCRPDPDIQSGYFSYVIQCRGFQEYVGLLGKGIMEIREAVRWGALKSVHVPLPDLDTQKAIADFLDKETARIDQLIEKKQRLVELLGERERSGLHRLVLPEGCMPSVNEVGDCRRPSWQLISLKRCLVERTCLSMSGEETLLSLRAKEGLVRHNDVSDKEVPPSALIGYKRIEPGQVVMNRMRAATGLFAIADEAGLVSPDYCTFDVLPNSSARFLLHLFKTRPLMSRFRLGSKGLGTGEAGFMRLNADRFLAIKVWLPEVQEQEDAGKQADLLQASMRQLAAKVGASIDRLKEYRSALITAAVTGQIDVTRWGQTGEGDKRLDQIQEEMAG